MPAPYSVDLRQRVIAAYEAGGQTYDSLAATFRVGVATVNRWLRRCRERGDVAPAPHGGGQKHRIDARVEVVLIELVKAQPDATLEELKAQLAARMERAPGRSTVARALVRLGITRKKRPSSPPSVKAMPRGCSAGTSRSSGSRTRSIGSSSSTRAG
jgi:transposase